MSKKDLQIKTLSKYRYRELKYLCLQYNELKEKMKEFSSGNVGAMKITGMPTANNISNSVQDIVIRKSEIEKKIKAIEQSAVEVDSVYYKDILYSVTENIRYEYINTRLCRTSFYALRRLFFSILDEKII